MNQGRAKKDSVRHAIHHGLDARGAGVAQQAGRLVQLLGDAVCCRGGGAEGVDYPGGEGRTAGAHDGFVFRVLLLLAGQDGAVGDVAGSFFCTACLLICCQIGAPLV